jgi:hypothetical protein
MKATPGEKAIHHYTQTSNLQNKKPGSNTAKTDTMYVCPTCWSGVYTPSQHYR